MAFYFPHNKAAVTQRILIGCIIGLLLVLLVIATIFIIFRISKRHRGRCLRYLKSDDDHRQRLNLSTTSPDDDHH
ncbi:unnamed protein product, partial [Rotaria magnacalcarata]